MPYISRTHKNSMESQLEDLVTRAKLMNDVGKPIDGVANYLISELVARLFKPEGGWDYASLARARACFVCAGEEFSRRLITSYEKSIIESNGDIAAYREKI